MNKNELILLAKELNEDVFDITAVGSVELRSFDSLFSCVMTDRIAYCAAKESNEYNEILKDEWFDMELETGQYVAKYLHIGLNAIAREGMR